VPASTPDILVKLSGDSLSEKQISEFTDFTIDNFYKNHAKYYNDASIEKFKSDRSIFFNLPYKYIYHMQDEKIIAYLAVCLIENHPYFKESVWHVGYWGISESLTYKSDRTAVKNSWAELLMQLNQSYKIAANIDYFNTSADKMAESFNFKTDVVRLDVRL
jgi:hypothetical protein